MRGLASVAMANAMAAVLSLAFCTVADSAPTPPASDNREQLHQTEASIFDLEIFKILPRIEFGKPEWPFKWPFDSTEQKQAGAGGP